MRALGFCVSVAHAEFMAREFVRRGLPAVAVSADTPTRRARRRAAQPARRQGQRRLLRGPVQRGRRRPRRSTPCCSSARPRARRSSSSSSAADFVVRTNKPCLTVLDFIGNASRQFRFDLRFRALLGGHRSDLIDQVEQGFPRLPSGCSIQLDRVAAGIVLQNVKGSLGSSFAGLVTELRAMAEARRLGGGDANAIGLADFLRDAALELDDLYKSNDWTWSRLRREAGLSVAPPGRTRPESPGRFRGCFTLTIRDGCPCISAR